MKSAAKAIINPPAAALLEIEGVTRWVSVVIIYKIRSLIELMFLQASSAGSEAASMVLRWIPLD